ncbi:MAG: eIF2A-related protein [Cuspidothrix sp.]
MVETQQGKNIVASNQQSLHSLYRAITFSKNQFSVILVCCNYQFLHDLIQQELVTMGWESESFQTINLHKKTTSLYATIQSQLTITNPAGLIIVGFESVDSIDDLWRSINQVRDEFRKSYSIPMIFWINDDILQKIWRLAPDFASWAATPIRFEMTAPDLLLFLQQETDNLFTRILDSDYSKGTMNTLEKIWTNSSQLHCAISELQNQVITIEAELKSSLYFVFGIDAYLNNRISSALTNFQMSLDFWEQTGNLFTHTHSQDEKTQKSVNYCREYYINEDDFVFDPKYSLKIAVLFLHIGLCFYRLGKQNRRAGQSYFQLAKRSFCQCFKILEIADYKKLLSAFIKELVEVLYLLEDWIELQVVAEKSLELHRIHGLKMHVACDYIVLAHIALHKLNWTQASILAHTSLIHLEETKRQNEIRDYLLPLLLEQIYVLTLAKALNKLEKKTKAEEYINIASQKLSLALESNEYQYDTYRYINLLEILRSLYFEAGYYLQSHIVKKRIHSLEQQYGFVPFIGAGCLKPQKQVTASTLANSSIALEITASGREYDVNNLIGRISRADQKLIIIHGQSGVGKSSLVTAGLVPALQNRTVGDQIAVPVVVQIYTDWLGELEKSLTKAMLKLARKSAIETQPLTDIYSVINIDIIYQKLRNNADHSLITVLIFDQFEEFFFGDTDSNKKQEFDKFISDCLSISFVKVILTLREDYLHRLLDFKHLSSIEAIGNNILDRKFRYEIDNFSTENARKLIENLTKRYHDLHQESQVQLEPALIDALVADLSLEMGEVRPIELQLVGAQLQDKFITTLAEYEPYRPNKLIQEYIQEIIKECGQENEQATLIVLYLLTDENYKRPFKTYAELKAELSELQDSSNLDLILDILVDSGLVVIVPNFPKQYQLIHDYLVNLIRHLQPQESGLQIQINKLRERIRNSYQYIEYLRTELRKTQQNVSLVHIHDCQGDNLLTELRELRKREEESQLQIERLRRELKEKELTEKLAASQKQEHLIAIRLNIALKIALTACMITIIGLTASVITFTDSEMKILSASSEALFASEKGIDALKESLKAGKKLERTLWSNSNTQEKVLTALYQAVYGVKERNRLEGHLSGVRTVIFSADKSLIASASADMTIKLWNSQGLLLKTLAGKEGHKDIINCVSFSPDSQMLVSGSQDQKIKLWSREGKFLKNLVGHTSVVNSVSFHPNGNVIASGSTDQTIKLWSKEGKLLKTLLGHKDAVLAVAWSNDGNILVSSSADKTIKFWNQDGKLLKTLLAHEDAILSIDWSPDSNFLASASKDKTIKLWNRDGKLLQTLSGHSSAVISVNFSHDGHTIASGSMDETVKLWSHKGNLLGTLRGHNSWVNSVSFSPDGHTLASASKDKTIILWRWDSLILRHPEANDDWITSVSFSPDSNFVAGASRDKTIKIWNREGELLNILTGHTDQVWGVAWSPDGKILASASRDKTIKLWNQQGDLLKTLEGHHDSVLTVAWSPAGKVIASGGKDKTIKFWSQEGELIKTVAGHRDGINWLSFSPNGKFLASASDDSSVKIWTHDGKIIKTLRKHSRSVNGVAWSPKGDILASVSLDSRVNIWNQNGQLKQTLMGDGDGFISVNFSPDGKTLAVSSDNQVRLWNQEGVLVMALKGDEGELTTINFSSDGTILAAGGSKGNVVLRKFSDITLASLLKRNCYILKDYLLNNSNIIRNDAYKNQSYYSLCEND